VNISRVARFLLLPRAVATNRPKSSSLEARLRAVVNCSYRYGFLET